jgi:hypothetical protein
MCQIFLSPYRGIIFTCIILWCIPPVNIFEIAFCGAFWLVYMFLIIENLIIKMGEFGKGGWDTINFFNLVKFLRVPQSRSWIPISQYFVVVFFMYVLRGKKILGVGVIVVGWQSCWQSFVKGHLLMIVTYLKKNVSFLYHFCR